MDVTTCWDWFRELNAATGIKLTIFYDAFDRARFINGFLTSVRLMALCIVASVVIGIVGACLLTWFFIYCYPISRTTAAIERRFQVA